MKPLCIYHGNCADGFGAAWVVRWWFNRQQSKAPLEERMFPDFYAGVYQTPPPDVTARDVIIVDFSYKRPVLLEMLNKCRSLLIIDHHKTAEADLAGLTHPLLIKIFNMKHSGAMLAWNYYFPDEKAPRLLEVIEDRDLWEFKFDYTRNVQASLFSYPYDFDVWTGLMHTPIQRLNEEGVAIERKHFKDIHELLAVVRHRRLIAGYNVPVANLPYIHSSDAGHIMAKGEPFAACYWDIPSGRVYSLRSADDGIDVSAVAKQYGGGGHKNAAGFTVPINHPLARRESGETDGAKLSTDV